MLGNRLSFGLSVEQEAGFHQYNLQTDIKQASLGVLLVILPLILFVFTDYESHGASTEFTWLVIFRVGVVLYCILQTAIMTRLSDYRAYHRSITIWALVIVALQFDSQFHPARVPDPPFDRCGHNGFRPLPCHSQQVLHPNCDMHCVLVGRGSDWSYSLHNSRRL